MKEVEQLKSTITNQESELKLVRNCLKDKDDRISKLERYNRELRDKFGWIKGAGLSIFAGFLMIAEIGSGWYVLIKLGCKIVVEGDHKTIIGGDPLAGCLVLIAFASLFVITLCRYLKWLFDW